MKKLIITTAIVLGLSLTSFADPNGGGVFGRGETHEQGTRLGGTPALPAHGQNTNQSAPVGSGIVVLTVLGAAYLLGKRHHEE